jgi:hypothetical protein
MSNSGAESYNWISVSDLENKIEFTLETDDGGSSWAITGDRPGGGSWDDMEEPCKVYDELSEIVLQGSNSFFSFELERTDECRQPYTLEPLKATVKIKIRDIAPELSG